MKTYTITGYQGYGTRDPSSYYVRVSYRGECLAEWDGTYAFKCALFYVARNGGRAIISMGDNA